MRLRDQYAKVVGHGHARLRTILYDDQPMLPTELDLLHTPSLQRLYDLHQLGFTDRVYIDASHSRLQHVVGVLEQVDNLVFAIAKNLASEGERTFQFGERCERSLSASSLARTVLDNRPIVRLIGLLHDLTHAPYGHTVEDEIELVGSKHDDPARQAEAYFRLLCEYAVWLGRDAGRNVQHVCPVELSTYVDDPDTTPPPNPTSVGNYLGTALREIAPEAAGLCWRLTPNEVADFLAQLRAAMTALLHLELLHKDEPEPQHFPGGDGSYDFQVLVDTALQAFGAAGYSERWDFDPRRDAYMLDVVGNTVCADLLDYAKRDSHHANLKLDYDAERIAEHFTLVACNENWNLLPQERNRRNAGPADQFKGWCLRTAISLFSHKLRTEVPGELMNLLNVRFYLYERAVYNPTKCAAGAMLGTALQLIGWRTIPGDTGGELMPAHLRTVGDAVFINEVRHAVKLVLAGTVNAPASTIRQSSQLTLARYLSLRRSPDRPEDIRIELEAGLRLLSRLRARRYYRPIFRALPSLQEKKLQVKAGLIGNTFREPEKRYQAERDIERRAGLALGSVVIHCPRPTTARKVANALLFFPGIDASDDKICRLRDIKCLVRKIFGKHQRAIKAVEKMYLSMWRLVVYVAPEYVPEHERIAEVVGQVLFEQVGSDEARGLFPQGALSNDPMLDRELRTRSREMEQRSAVKDGSEEPVNARAAEGYSVVSTILERLASERGVDLDPGQTPDALEQKIRSLFLEAPGSVSPEVRPEDSVEGIVATEGLANIDRFLTVLAQQLGVKRFSQTQKAKFSEFYEECLVAREQEAFDAYLLQMEEAFKGTTSDRHRPFNIAVVLKNLRALLDGTLFTKDPDRPGN